MPDSKASDPKGGARWAPIVIFGAMFLIGAIGVTVVGVSHCNRDQPYLDQVKLPYNPNEIRPIPPKIIPPGLGK